MELIQKRHTKEDEEEPNEDNLMDKLCESDENVDERYTNAVSRLESLGFIKITEYKDDDDYPASYWLSNKTEKTYRLTANTFAGILINEL